MEGQIQLIALELIDRPVKIARETIDPVRVRELAESIRESGLLQPVILRPSNGRYEMVAGDRRYLAHKLLGLKEIKAIIKPLDDRETVVIRAIENLQRENLTPSEEGNVYLLLKEEGGLTQTEIARKCGKDKETIKRYLDFVALPVEVRSEVDRKRIAMDAAVILREIEEDDMFMYYFRMGVENGITIKTARLWVDDYYSTKRGTYYAEVGGSPSPEIPIEAMPGYMACHVCLGACETGKIRNVAVCPDCLKRIKGMPHVKV